MHCGPEQPKIQTEVLGHSLVPLLVCSHCSLVRLLAYFAHSLARVTVNDWMAIYSVLFCILAHSVLGPPLRLSLPLRQEMVLRPPSTLSSLNEFYPTFTPAFSSFARPCPEPENSRKFLPRHSTRIRFSLDFYEKALLSLLTSLLPSFALSLNSKAGFFQFEKKRNLVNSC